MPMEPYVIFGNIVQNMLSMELNLIQLTLKPLYSLQVLRLIKIPQYVFHAVNPDPARDGPRDLGRMIRNEGLRVENVIRSIVGENKGVDSGLELDISSVLELEVVDN